MLVSNRDELLLKKVIAQHCINLAGMNVFTEAASGYYAYSPIIAALAGAEGVYCITKDSRFASADQVITGTYELASKFGVSDRIHIEKKVNLEWVSKSDIVTNSGFVRPIDRAMISSMKSTSVIPLMWETWEFRPGEIDVDACINHSIPVIGVNESKEPNNTAPYNAFTALKMLFDMGFEGYKEDVLLLGSCPNPAGMIHERLSSLGVNTVLFSSTGSGCYDYSEFEEYFKNNGHNYDLILCAEHRDSRKLLGKGGLIDYEAIKQINPNIGIAVYSGNLDEGELKNSGIPFFPEKIQPYGYMSYQPYELGPRPVFELYACGLKAAELYVRARLRGDSVDDSIAHSVKCGYGQLFDNIREFTKCQHYQDTTVLQS